MLNLNAPAGSLTSEAQQKALARVDQRRASWLEESQLVERARKLIRYAAVMSDAKICRGKERREAVEAVQRAAQAHDEARGANVAGRAVDGLRTLWRIGERVALSAVKSARSKRVFVSILMPAAPRAK